MLIPLNRFILFLLELTLSKLIKPVVIQLSSYHWSFRICLGRPLFRFPSGWFLSVIFVFSHLASIQRVLSNYPGISKFLLLSFLLTIFLLSTFLWRSNFVHPPNDHKNPICVTSKRCSSHLFNTHVWKLFSLLIRFNPLYSKLFKTPCWCINKFYVYKNPFCATPSVSKGAVMNWYYGNDAGRTEEGGWRFWRIKFCAVLK